MLLPLFVILFVGVFAFGIALAARSRRQREHCCPRCGHAFSFWNRPSMVSVKPCPRCDAPLIQAKLPTWLWLLEFLAIAVGVLAIPLTGIHAEMIGLLLFPVAFVNAYFSDRIQLAAADDLPTDSISPEQSSRPLTLADTLWPPHPPEDPE